VSGYGRPPRLGAALVIAPLAAPLAMMLGSVARAIVDPRVRPEGTSLLVGVLFLTALLVVYGAPLAYATTLIVLWPAAALLREAGAFTWWSLTLVATIAGGIVFPLYLHALDPRATWSFFPGAGFAAGAATGWSFWFIATRNASPEG
jgi:hypothetical protein